VTIWNHNYCVEAARTNSTQKQARVVEAALAEGLLDVRDVPIDEVRVWADIASTHAPEYVEAVRTGDPRALAQSQGFRWSPEFAESVARIWNGHQAACRLALERGIVLHPVSGSHHAGYSHGGGFCTFAFLVGAGRALLREGLVQRVAIIDLDAHTGNGTWELVHRDKQFALFDLAGWPWIPEQDDGRVIYRAAKNAEEYMEALHSLPAWLDANKPQIVQYQAGADPFEGDDIGGIPGVTTDLLRERDAFVIRELLARKIPTVIDLAGGYVPGVTEGLHL
jgi:acetoin utilization deacetylase AcuC-like enzyme